MLNDINKKNIQKTLNYI